MRQHGNAALTVEQRGRLVKDLKSGMTMVKAAEVYGVSMTTIYRWQKRAKQLGDVPLVDRTSRPHSMPTAIPEETRQAILRLRREGKVCREIAKETGVSLATASRVIKRAGVDTSSQSADLRSPAPSS